jgi:hypothetical protein
MVALDNNVSLGKQKVPFALPKISLVGAIALAAIAVAAGSLAARGFSDPDNGFRLASQNAWRFASFVFFAAIIAGPLGRLIPGLGHLAQQSCKLFWGFCASYGVYLVAVLLPNAFGPQNAERASVNLFLLFGAGVTLVMALAISPRMAEKMGEGVQRALFGVSTIYFWLCYAMMGLAYISHPHRPDGYYGLVLGLMIGALLIRFADSFVMRMRPANRAA